MTGGHMPKAPFNAVKCLLISMAIGLVIALIVTGSMKAKTKIGADAVCRRKLCKIKQYEHN